MAAACDVIGGGADVRRKGREIVDQRIDRILHALVIALAGDLHPLGQIAVADEAQHAIALGDRQDDRIQHAVDAGDQPGEIADEALHVAALAQLAGRGGGNQALDFTDDGAQIGAQRLDRLVDEGLLARKLFERGIEIAFAELLDAGHRHLLHGDVAGDHLVDALGHGAEIAAELLDGHEDVDIALVVLDRHVVHLGDQALQIAAQRLDRLVDEGLFTGQGLHGSLEIALAEFPDAGHRLLLDGDVRADEIIDGGSRDSQIALEAIDGQHRIDLAALVLGGHMQHGILQQGRGPRGGVQKGIHGQQDLLRRAGRAIGAQTAGEIAVAECLGQALDFADRGLGPRGSLKLGIERHWGISSLGLTNFLILSMRYILTEGCCPVSRTAGLRLVPRVFSGATPWRRLDVTPASRPQALWRKSSSSWSGPPMDMSRAKPLARACWAATE